MMMKSKPLAAVIGVLLILGVLVAVASAQTATPTPAPANERIAAPSNMAELLNTLIANEQAVTFDFIVPVVTGERVWTLPDEAVKRVISAVGDDYVCFSEPWNDGSRERCTPFSNISSITFLK